MGRYRIEVKLLTEAIFGSGHSIPGSVDLEIVYDEYGFPYMNAKTFKGNFRDIMSNMLDLIGRGKYGYLEDDLLGKENSGLDSWKNLKFSDCMIAENIRNILIYGVEEGTINPLEIKEALTDVRSFTSVEDDGSYIQGSLRQFRVIKKDLKFIVNIHCERELSQDELGILAITCSALRHIGSMRTRGKGGVECKFQVLENGEYKDKTNYYIDKFMEGVIRNA